MAICYSQYISSVAFKTQYVFIGLSVKLEDLGGCQKGVETSVEKQTLLGLCMMSEATANEITRPHFQFQHENSCLHYILFLL